LGRRVALCPQRKVLILPVVDQIPVEGLYNSAEDSKPLEFDPPVTSITIP